MGRLGLGGIALAALLLALGCAAPRDPVEVQLEEGEAALATGDLAAARSAFRAALAEAPKSERARLGLLEVALAEGDGPGAIAALDALEGAGVPSPRRCEALLLGGGSSPKVLDRAVAEPCPGARAIRAAQRIARADADREAGRVEQATAGYRAAWADDPGRADAAAAAAELLLEAGRVDEAVELLSAALERHPESRSLRDLMVAALAIR